MEIFKGYRGTARNIGERVEAEESLRLAKEAADRANRAKSEFLSSMSHELRTPLNAVLGFGQLLEINPKEPLSAAQREYVGYILKSGDHLLGLIDQVLELAKIEVGRAELTLKDVAPRRMIGECLALVRRPADERGIILVDRSDRGDLPDIHTDDMRCRQLLLNLLSNAVKYNRDGGQVTVGCVEQADGMLRIEVSDTGEGIPADKQDQLFQPFNRLGRESGDVEGSGIGLTITKQLAELLGGRIGFESEAGCGSTFWVDLPLTAGKTLDGTRTAPPAATPKGRSRTIGSAKRTILYVEDNPANLKLMEAIVRLVPNLEMLAAPNAELGLDLAKKHGPDVILMDIGLPGMDGFEALKRLRRSKRTRTIPVIALTANAIREDIERSLEAGFRRLYHQTDQNRRGPGEHRGGPDRRPVSRSPLSHQPSAKLGRR